MKLNAHLSCAILNEINEQNEFIYEFCNNENDEKIELRS